MGGSSELVLLEQLEEVLDLETAVLGHVGAVHNVSDSVLAESRSVDRNNGEELAVRH